MVYNFKKSFIILFCLFIGFCGSRHIEVEAMVGSGFVNASITGNQSQDIISVAMAQYNRTEAQMGYGNTFAAKNWCVAFVVDSAEKAGISSDIIPRTNYIVSDFYNVLKATGATDVPVPEPGDIAFCNGWGHVEIVASRSGSSITVVGGNGGGSISKSQVYTSPYQYSDSWFNKFVRPKYKNNSFISLLDTPAAGKTYSGNVGILGYAMHKNGIDHVTAWVNGNVMNCPQYSDPSLTKLCPGSPAGKEGFTGSIPISYLKDGSNKIDVYAYEKNDTPHLVASRTFNYSADKVAPKTTNVRISNVDDTGYTVSCNIWDDQKVGKVVYVTWTPDKDGFDDKIETTVTTGLEMKDHVASVSFRVNTKDHNNEKGRYATHIYAYDAWGNSDNRLTNAAIGGDYWTPTKSVSLNGKTYDLYDTTYWNWTTAKSYCDSIGGYLACINTKEEQEIVNELLKSGKRDGYWIGATDQYVEGDWAWVTSETMSYKYWQSGQPDNYNNTEHYGMVWRSSGKWNDVPEDVRDADGNGVYGFICERTAVKAGKYYSVTDVSANIRASLYGSKGNGIKSAGFYFGEGNNTMSKYEVISNDNISRADIDIYVNDYVGELKPQTEYHYQFYFTDGNGQETKGTLGTFTTEKAFEKITQDVLSKPNAVMEFDGRKYYRFDFMVNHWEIARRACEAMGGHLVTITSEEEQVVVANLMANGGIYGYWVGGIDRSSEGIWQWITGEEWKYSNWDETQPDDSDGIEDYLTIYKDNPRKWNDTREHYTKVENGIKGFICEVEKPETYKISYHLNGGTLKGQNPTSYTSDNNKLKLESPVKEHYTFLGWFDAETHGQQISAETEFKGDMDLYAYWEPEKYTLYLDGNGGQFAGSDEKDISYGEPYGKLPVPTRVGYDFTGWYVGETDNIKVDENTICRGHTSVCAHWSAVKVQISFDSKEGNEVSPKTVEVIYDSAYGTLPISVREGYVFQGWYLEAEGGEQILETSVVKNAEAHILYAHWQKEAELPHVHSYTDKVTRKATCTEDGVRTFTCSECGDYYTEIIKAAGHQFSDWKITEEATCQNEGKETRICTECGKVEAREVPKTDHQYEENVIAPTCTSFGYTEHICTTCGDSYRNAYKNYADHTIVTDKAVTATCTSTGLTEGSHCSVCGKILKAQKVLEKKEHRYDTGVITEESTCTTHGYKTFICQDCGNTRKEELPPIDHVEVTNPEIPATCDTYGLTEGSHCDVCGTVSKEQEPLEPLGHKYEGEITKEATCTEEGEKTYICLRCGDSYIEKIPKTAHIIKVDPAVEPTETSTGLTAGSHCSVCGIIIKKQEIIQKKTPDIKEEKTVVDPAHPAVEQQEKAITSQKGDADPKDSTFQILCARVKKSAKTSNTITWNKVKGASGYVIYGNRCGTKYRFKKLAQVKRTTWTHKKLKKGTYYKYLVVAYKNVSGIKSVITASKTMHAATSGGKVGNCKQLKLNKTKVILKRKKTFMIKAKEVAASKKLKIKRHRKVAFASSNPKIATVTKAGKVKALNRGSCKIYVYAQNGIYKILNVTVK